MSRQAQRHASQTGSVARIALALERLVARPALPQAQPFLILAGQVNVSHIGSRIEISSRGSIGVVDRHQFSTGGVLRGFAPAEPIAGSPVISRIFIVGIGASQQSITVDVESKVMLARGLQ